MIKDFKVFIYVLLSKFSCRLFPFIVGGKGLLVRVEELGCKWCRQLRVLSIERGGGRGGLVKNPGTATSIKASLGSLALITYLGARKQLEMGLNPRITCTARSCPSRWSKIFYRKIQLRSAKFTKFLFGAV